MIQDIAPHTFENHYHPEARVKPEDPVLIVRKEKILCRILSEKERDLDPEAFRDEEQIHDGTGTRLAASHRAVLEFPTWEEVCGWKKGWKKGTDPGGDHDARENLLTYLFTIDETNYFLLDSSMDAFPVSRSNRSSKGDEIEGNSRNLSRSSVSGTHDSTVVMDETVASTQDLLPEGYGFYTLSDLREQDVGPKVREFAAMTGIHLAHWYRNNQFCGRCGTRTVKDTVERALCCPNCGNKIYPRIVPAVIVGILNPRTNQILLTKYRVGYSHYALVAGFTEIGESLEGTVRREVMEETGLRVKNIRYYKSQPWGIVDDLLAGFYCEVDGDDTIRMDPGELKVAEWVSPENVELQPQDFSLTNEMMYRFKDGKI